MHNAKRTEVLYLYGACVYDVRLIVAVWCADQLARLQDGQITDFRVWADDVILMAADD